MTLPFGGLARSAARETLLSQPSDTRPACRSIFHEAWWLDAASNAQWAEVRVTWDRQTVAVLPFVVCRRYGLTRITMPPYARVLGPRLALPPAKPVQRLAQLRNVMRALQDRLPDHDWFVQTLPPDAEDAAGFALNGWHVEASFTFRSPPSISAADAWQSMDAKTRNQVRQAGQRLPIERHGDADRFIALLRRQYDGRRNAHAHDYPALARILSAALARERAAILAALDDAGRDAASAALLWDEDSLYFWVSARDPERSGGSALSLLVWEATKLAKQHGLTMDFDGFATPAGGCFMAGFGGAPVVRPVVIRRTLRGSALLALRDLAAALTRGATAMKAGM
jgi:hypothetical protein